MQKRFKLSCLFNRSAIKFWKRSVQAKISRTKSDAFEEMLNIGQETEKGNEEVSKPGCIHMLGEMVMVYLDGDWRSVHKDCLDELIARKKHKGEPQGGKAEGDKDSKVGEGEVMVEEEHDMVAVKQEIEKEGVMAEAEQDKQVELIEREVKNEFDEVESNSPRLGTD